MATNYVQPGDTISYAHSSAVASGELVAIGTIAGVALGKFDADESGSYGIDGVFELPKADAAGEMTAGAKAYHASGEVTDADTDPFAGIVVEDAAAGDSTIKVRVNFGNS